MQLTIIFSVFILLPIPLVTSLPTDSLVLTQVPQFTWTSPLSIHAQYNHLNEDTINLYHAQTVPNVVVICLFQGIFKEETNGSAVITGCNDDPVVHITIISKHLWGRTMFDIRGNTTEEVVSAYSGKQTGEDTKEDARYRRSTFPVDYDQYDYSIDFSGAEPVPSDLVLKMKLGYDESMKRLLGSDAAAQKYIAEVVTHGKEYLKHNSLNVNIFLDIQEAPQLIANKELDISMTSFEQVQSIKLDEPIPLSVFCYTNDDDTDMGLARRAKACDNNLGISMIKWRCNVLKAAQTFAHESGHMNGLFHDMFEDDINGGVTNCRGTGIMSDRTPFDDRPNEWSICSRERFAKWYNRNGKDCLVEAIPCDDGSGVWSIPCKCGAGDRPSLCVSGHTCCETKTSTCLGEPSDIVKLYAIIENMKKELNGIHHINTPKVCQSGWRKFEEKCYKVFPEPIPTYSAAQTKCQTEGGDLVSLETEAESTFIKNMLDQLQLNGILPSGRDLWLSAKRDNTHSPFVWNTGRYFTYSDWFPGQPSYNKYLCMEIYKNNNPIWQWHGAFCYQDKVGEFNDNGVACEKTTVQGITCPHGWTTLLTGCYLFDIASSGTTHQGAKTFCENVGGFLAEIYHQEEQDALWQFCQDNGNCQKSGWWLGATDQVKENEWKWEYSDKSVTFEAFMTGEPNNDQNNESCLVANSPDLTFKWNDINCSRKEGLPDKNLKALCKYSITPSL